MATSGSVAPLLALMLMLMAGGACSQPSGQNGENSPTAKPETKQSPSVTPTLSPAVTPTLQGLAKATCTVATPATWAAIIQQSSSVLPQGSRVIPFATGIDPSRFFAELFSAAWSGVVTIAVPSGKVTHIAAFKDPTNDQAYSGAFDGRWLVWVNLLSTQDSNNWQIWAWDSSTGQSFEVAAAPSLNGSPVSGPFVQPVAFAGRAAWVQANQAGAAELHLYSLQDHHDQIVGSDAGYPVLFWGSDLIWQHVDVPGQSGHLQMLDVASGRPLTVPAPLATVSHLASLAVSDRLVAWTDGASIWAYRPGQTSASLVYQPTGDSAGFLGIADDLITWDGTSQPFALDVRSATVTNLTPANGGRFASGNSLLLYWPNSQSKSTSAQFSVSDVDASKLPPLPSCS